MTTTRSCAVILVALVALAGCGGGAAKKDSPSKPSADTSAPQINPSSTPAVPAGAVTVTTKEGYVYKLQAQPPTTAPTVTLGLNTKNAPPGRDFIVINVSMSSGLTDRPEPMYEFGDPTSPYHESGLQVAVPTADLAQFGASAQDCRFIYTGKPFPAGWCPLSTNLVSWTPDPQSPTSPQLPVGQSETLVVAVETSVPTSAPVAHVALFADVSGQPPTRIPWQS